MGDLEIKLRYKVKKENIKKLKVFLKKINNGKRHQLGKNIL